MPAGGLPRLSHLKPGSVAPRCCHQPVRAIETDPPLAVKGRKRFAFSPAALYSHQHLHVTSGLGEGQRPRAPFVCGAVSEQKTARFPSPVLELASPAAEGDRGTFRLPPKACSLESVLRPRGAPAYHRPHDDCCPLLKPHAPTERRPQCGVGNTTAPGQKWRCFC